MIPHNIFVGEQKLPYSFSLHKIGNMTRMKEKTCCENALLYEPEKINKSKNNEDILEEEEDVFNIVQENVEQQE